MTVTAVQPRHGRPARHRHRSKPVIAVLTTALGLWLGLTAPSVSPVAPPLPGSPQVVAAVDQSVVGPPAPLVTPASALVPQVVA